MKCDYLQFFLRFNCIARADSRIISTFLEDQENVFEVLKHLGLTRTWHVLYVPFSGLKIGNINILFILAVKTPNLMKCDFWQFFLRFSYIARSNTNFSYFEPRKWHIAHMPCASQTKMFLKLEVLRLSFLKM